MAFPDNIFTAGAGASEDEAKVLSIAFHAAASSSHVAVAIRNGHTLEAAYASAYYVMADHLMALYPNGCAALEAVHACADRRGLKLLPELMQPEVVH